LKPFLIVLAGPNGAGKSTFYNAYLSHLDLPFLNADLLNQRLGISAYEAADAIAHLRDLMIEQKRGFITESVLSDPVGEKVGIFKAAASAGFDVRMVYIGLQDVALSTKRVKQRVMKGGHDVPMEKLEGRFARSLLNLERAISYLPSVTLYDNSSPTCPHRFVAEFSNGNLVRQNSKLRPDWAVRHLGPQSSAI
jgi:predicted ABC-type ATPase